jgi:hypothetical protein
MLIYFHPSFLSYGEREFRKPSSRHTGFPASDTEEEEYYDENKKKKAKKNKKNKKKKETKDRKSPFAKNKKQKETKKRKSPFVPSAAPRAKRVKSQVEHMHHARASSHLFYMVECYSGAERRGKIPQARSQAGSPATPRCPPATAGGVAGTEGQQREFLLLSQASHTEAGGSG